MAKTINTRIKNRFDTLANWQKSGIELLPGEIALVSVTTQQIDATTGNVVDVPAVLLKVGESDGNGGSKAFSSLPWLSAKAADVYGWAKKASAEEVPVTIMVGDTSTAGTLGGWIKSINDAAATNAQNISAVSEKVDVEKVSTAISSAVSGAVTGLTSTTSGSGTFVKSVVQADGKVAVTYGTIDKSELPELSTSDIKAGDKTLAAKLSDMDQLIAANTSKLTGHTDAAINTLIDNKINELDVSDSGTGYVTAVTQTDGKISVTKSSLPTADANNAGIVKLGATGGAATFDAVSELSGKVNKNAEDIGSLKTTIAGGVHFIGTTTTELVDGSTTNPISVNSENHAPTAGDVVLYGEKEFIWDGTKWKELGDLSRVGAIETAIAAMDHETSAAANTFLTSITQVDGKITSVGTARPTAADIQRGSSDVGTDLNKVEQDVSDLKSKVDVDKVSTAISTAVSNAVNGLDHEVSGSGAFVKSVTQTDGKVTVTYADITEANLPDISTSKVKVDASTDLAAKLSAMDQSIATNTSKLAGHTDEAINTLIDTKINTLDATVNGSGDYVTNVEQTDGKVTVTKGSLPTASDSVAGIVKLGATGGAAKHDDFVTLKDTTVPEIAQDVANIESNYMRIGTDNKLYQGTSGVDTIIFDCGGAELA
jgi:hypothetical protein